MKQHIKLSVTFLILLFVLPPFALAWQGKVVGISDGDTITVLTEEKKQVKVRLYGIDCPEKSQAFGQRAKRFSSDLAFGKIVEVNATDTDRYGRTVARVIVDGKDLNEELLRAGYAWHYKQYSKDPDLADMERKARASKLGLWADPHALEPWAFRRGGKSEAAEPETAEPKKEAAYHGNYKTRVFHGSGCRCYGCKACTTIFRDRGEAVKAGYAPCKICNP